MEQTTLKKFKVQEESEGQLWIEAQGLLVHLVLLDHLKELTIWDSTGKRTSVKRIKLNGGYRVK